MSDALTDMNRDIERANLTEGFIEALAEYLSNPTDEGRQKVFACAEDVDNLRRGYWTSKTNLHSYIEKNLDNLIVGDKEAWMSLLFRFTGYRKYKKLKELSPFKDTILLIADYGYGFVTFEGEIESEIYTALRDRGYKAYHGEAYIIVLPNDVFRNANIVKVR